MVSGRGRQCAQACEALRAPGCPAPAHLSVASHAMLQALLPHLRREAAHLRVVQAVGDFCRECRLKAKQLLVGEAVGQHSRPDGCRALVNGGAACMRCSHSQERRQRQQGATGVECHGQLQREDTGEWASTNRECGVGAGRAAAAAVATGASGHIPALVHQNLRAVSSCILNPVQHPTARLRKLAGGLRTLGTFLAGIITNCDRASPRKWKDTLGDERTNTAPGTQLSTSTEDAIAAAPQLRNTGKCEPMELRGQLQA